MTLSQDDFDQQLRAACAEPISGWRFPFLDGRRVVDELRWDYPALARELVPAAARVLDHGTGGGEVLAEIGGGRELTVATEAYAPNVPVAARRLAPLGIPVVHVAGGTFDTRGPDAEYPDRRLPFADETFDLVLARHVAFSSAEVFRVLRPGGQVLTQMGRVGVRRPGEVEVTDYFPGAEGPPWPPWQLTDHLAAAGFEIEDYREQLQRTHFRDLAALVYFLRTVPWAIPDFTVDGYRDHLWHLYERITTDGSLVTAGTALLARAVKPA
ncbi:methyltransferase family protein [Kribbella amoyensis]|uniref:Methyltransferase family protein n=1 Tax=Kribbella amoyensis TaxID=996641 RepID=A0A561BSB3_9ACTN|nr:methyltransferase domain-containing protein [Kribbella amoyensis]TWD81756.1 methyltransferase family protein [Kribbella amoyensis]